MLGVAIASDVHNQPDGLKECASDWIHRGIFAKHRLVGAGDWFDLLPLGRSRWSSSSPAVLQLARELDGYELELVEGNHDPYAWLRDLFLPWPNISVLHELNILDPDNNHAYRISHGYQWSIDWGYLKLNTIMPPVIEWIVARNPEAWYKFCKSHNWLASLDPEAGIEHETLTPLTRVIRAGATRSAANHNRCEIFGHTHLSGEETVGVSSRAGFRRVYVDCGNLPDTTYCLITDDARIRFM